MTHIRDLDAAPDDVEMDFDAAALAEPTLPALTRPLGCVLICRRHGPLLYDHH
jgi:hypothetical protein